MIDSFRRGAEKNRHLDFDLVPAAVYSVHLHRPGHCRGGGRSLGEGGKGRHLRCGAGGGRHHRRGGGDGPGRGGDAEKHHRRVRHAGDSGGLCLPVPAIGGAISVVQALRLSGGGGGSAGAV